jgi:hypothetical protein
MKKHDFNSAIEIFKSMFEGWKVVDNNGKKYRISGVDTINNQSFLVFDIPLETNQILHLEQNQPKNGDEVLAWGINKENGTKATYIGKTIHCTHACETPHGGIFVCNYVELIAPVRKLTIEQATEMLKNVINEPFEIITQ